MAAERDLENLASLEYQSLRAEILECNKEANQAITIMIGFVGAVYAYILSRAPAGPHLHDAAHVYGTQVVLGLFLCLMIIFGYGQLVASKRKSIWRISTYIMIFIEDSDENIGWETRLNERSARSSRSWKDISVTFIGSDALMEDRYTFMLAPISTLLILLAMAVPRLDAFDFVPLQFLIVALGIGVLLEVFHFHRLFSSLARGGTIHARYDSQWRKLRESESLPPARDRRRSPS